jgi:uncharacterized tellurite resistance protein B-like protein
MTARHLPPVHGPCGGRDSPEPGKLRKLTDGGGGLQLGGPIRATAIAAGSRSSTDYLPIMLDSLRVLIADSLPTIPEMDEPVTPRDVRVAACAMMLEVGYADGRLSEDERKLISKSLVSHFGVDARGSEEIMHVAQQQLAMAPSEIGFASQLVAEYDEDQRIMLAEMLHEIGSADGWLDGNEEFVIGKLEQWLGVPRSAFLGDTTENTE